MLGFSTSVIWVSKTWPIQRRWELRRNGRFILAIGLSTVEWSRHGPPPDAEISELKEELRGPA